MLDFGRFTSAEPLGPAYRGIIKGSVEVEGAPLSRGNLDVKTLARELAEDPRAPAGRRMQEGRSGGFGASSAWLAPATAPAFAPRSFSPHRRALLPRRRMARVEPGCGVFVGYRVKYCFLDAYILLASSFRPGRPILRPTPSVGSGVTGLRAARSAPRLPLTPAGCRLALRGQPPGVFPGFDQPALTTP